MPPPRRGEAFPPRHHDIALPYEWLADATDVTVGQRLERAGASAEHIVELLGRRLLSIEDRGTRTDVHALGQPLGEGATLLVHSDHYELRDAG